MRSTETLAAWVLALVVILGMGLTLGCSMVITKDGMFTAFGDATAGSDCEDGDPAKCKNLARGGEMGAPFAGVATEIIKAGVRLVDGVPGVELGNPDTLKVEIVTDGSE